MTTLLSFTPYPHFLSSSAVHRRHHPPPTTITLKKSTTNEKVRFLCSPYQRVSRFGVQCGVSAIAHDLVYNAGATMGVLGGAYALVFAFDDLTKRMILHQSLSRKLVHIFSGLLFLVSWPIFRELLRGPLYYVMILILCDLVFWRESPIGVISLAMMCGGDGVADIIGRRYGSIKIPYNHKKSLAGSISMLVIGFLISLGMLYYYSILGHVKLEWEFAEELNLKMKKYLRGQVTNLEALKDKKLRTQLTIREELYGKSAKAAAKAEKWLMPSKGGYLEPEGIEKTWRIRQEAIAREVDIISSRNQYDIILPELGPYTLDFTSSGRYMAIGGRKGHLGIVDIINLSIIREMQVRETVRDVVFLHNELFFAAAQKK